MPKAALYFKLPEENEEFKIACKAGAMDFFIHEFGEKLRRRYKHTDPKNNDAYEEYEAIREEFFNLLEEHLGQD